LDITTKYIEKLNHVKIDDMDCKMLVDYITDKAIDLSFTEYAKTYIREMCRKRAENTIEICMLSVKVFFKTSYFS
jgi:hypothetical protein